MPKVTVYIPSYNYGKYLHKAIQSVMAQTFGNWELIVINDGSTDHTQEVLSTYHQNAKIKIIHQQQKGLTVSNNIALRLSRGDYIIRLDADDYFDENALLILSNTLDSHPEAGLVYPDYYQMDEQGTIVNIERREKVSDEETTVLDLPAHGACTMIRKFCLMELGGYNEKWDCQDGYDLWIRFIQKYKPYHITTPLFYYRKHHHSLTQDKQKLLSARQQIKRAHVENKFGKNIPKVLAIIPVRKELHPLIHMPLKEIAGKPLIDYTIIEALKTNLLDRLVVISDDKDILGYTKKYKRICAIPRPTELSTSNSPIEPTIHFVLSTLKEKEGYEPEAVMLLYLHAPTRRYIHIEKAIDTMIIFDVSSVISVSEDLNIYYQHTSAGLVPLQNQRLLRLERDALYKENGAIYLSKRSAISENKFLSTPLGHIIMTPEESIKIDSEFNYWVAQKLLEERKV